MSARLLLFFAGCLGVAACSSPVTPPHVNTVTATINDTAWSATTIAYLQLETLTATSDSINVLAYGSGDTLEFHGVVDKNSPYTIVQPYDFVVLRRARGVFQIHLGADAFLDSIKCSRLSFGVVEGTVVTGAALKNVNNVNDSAKIRCSFSLSSPLIP